MDRISAFMAKADIPDDMPIQAGMVSKAVEGAQRQIEAMNFAARKHVLEYDDVMNKQREVIYKERGRVLDGKDIHERVESIVSDVVISNVLVFCPERVYAEDWDWEGLTAWFRDLTGLGESVITRLREDAENPHLLAGELAELVLKAYAEKERDIGAEGLRELERQVMLRIIDARWMEHLQEMDYLKEGIGLRAMGQRDPKVEYKNEAYDMFAGMVQGVNEDFIRTVMHMQFVVEEPDAAAALRNVRYSAPSESSIFAGAAEAAAAVGVDAPSPDAIAAAAAMAGGGARTATVVKDKADPWADVGRNEPCPCGSGKKYKKCHGAGA
jgi:preprotein translocase subunit SecA